MHDPKRWLEEESEADDQERALLLLGLGDKVDPPTAAEEATWQALLRQIGPGTPGSDAPPDAPAGPPADTGPLGASALPKLPLLASPLSKLVLSVSLLGVASGVILTREPSAPPLPPAAIPRAALPLPAESHAAPEVSAALTQPPGPPSTSPPEPARRPRPSVASAPLPLAPGLPSADPPAVEPPPDAPASAPQGSSAPEGERMQRMLRESQLVGQARAELQGGNAAAALRTLATLDEQIPRGNLRQEREVLTIEALSASGQRAAAGQRAEAFLRLFPRSPYAARLQAFVPGR